MFYEILKRPKVEDLCAKAQIFAEEAMRFEAAGNTEDARKARDKAGYWKKQLPVFMFQANFENNRRTNKTAKPNGLVMLDFDHVEDPRKMWNEALQQHGLGLTETVALAAITPSGHGLRLVCVGNALLPYADNQRLLAERIFGMPMDEACKDFARCSFAFPDKNLLYVSDKLFNYQYEFKGNEKFFEEPHSCAQPAPVRSAGRTPTDLHTAERTEEENPAGAAVGDGLGGGDDNVLYRGVPIKKIIELWWTKVPKGEPQEGDRNVKLQRLATNLRYICDNKQDVLLRVMPRYGLGEDEMRTIIESSCKYPLMNYLPKTLRAVLAECGIEWTVNKEMSGHVAAIARPVKDGVLATEEELMYWAGRLEDINLPTGLAETVKGVVPHMRMTALISCLPAIYTLATGVQFFGWDGLRQRLSITVCTIGGASSGKSFSRPLVANWIAPLRAADQASRQVENNYKREREANQGKKTLEHRPIVIIREVPSTVSLASLFERSANDVRQVKNLQGHNFPLHLHLYTEEWEFAAVVRNMKKDFSNYSDLLIKSHHDEKVGVDYRNDASANGIRNIHWNQMYAGNIVDFWKLFPDSQILNGMPTRVLVGFVPENSFRMNERFLVLHAHERSIIKQTAFKLDGINGMIDATPCVKAMFARCEEWAKWAEKENNRVADIIRRRSYATIGLRAGVISAVLRNLDKWDKLPTVNLSDEGTPEDEQVLALQLPFTEDDIAFAKLIGDWAFEFQYKLFSIKMQRALDQSMEINAGVEQTAHRQKTIDTFSCLPEIFKLNDVMKIFNFSSNGAAGMAVKRWINDGFVEKLKHGQYKKLRNMKAYD